MVAVQNAKTKAAELAEFLGAQVGGILSLNEECSNEWEGLEDGGTNMDSAVASVQQRLTQATMHVSVKVAATFELKTKAKSKTPKQ